MLMRMESVDLFLASFGGDRRNEVRRLTCSSAGGVVDDVAVGRAGSTGGSSSASSKLTLGRGASGGLTNKEWRCSIKTRRKGAENERDGQKTSKTFCSVILLIFELSMVLARSEAARQFLRMMYINIPRSASKNQFTSGSFLSSFSSSTTIWPVFIGLEPSPSEESKLFFSAVTPKSTSRALLPMQALTSLSNSGE